MNIASYYIRTTDRIYAALHNGMHVRVTPKHMTQRQMDDWQKAQNVNPKRSFYVPAIARR